VLAFVVLLPLLGRGYILTLDMVFTPHLRMPASVSSSYLLHVLFHVLNLVVPSDVIEKIILFLILFLSGVGVHKLVQSLSAKRPDTYQRLGCYFAGLLYTINPFTYDRFMAGQYNVLLGYALLPWFTRAMLKLLAQPAWRSAIVLAAWATAASIVSIHAVGLMAILAVTGLGLKSWQQRDNKPWLRQALKFGLLAAAMFIAASSYWLIPLALGHGSTATTISSFNTTDQSAFATLGGSTLGRLGSVVRLQGFWAEGRDLYSLPQDQVPVWGLLALIVWLIVITGVMSLWRVRQRFIVVLLAASALIAAMLAIGTINGWLVTRVPFFAGYREPEKFVALVALAYAVFAGHGVAAILKYCHDQGGKFFLIVASVILLLVPLVWTPTMLRGFDNQLTLAQYPADWFTINKRLDADPSRFQVLFLPWHQYMYFNFAGRIIASPAPAFFDKPVVVSNNPEFEGIPPVPNTLDASVAGTLAGAPESTTIGTPLAKLHIKYVLLARDDDYANYSYLGRQADLKLVAKSATLELYRNVAFGGQ
jgi:hypothetical protein